MGYLCAILVFPFMTLPSLLYGILHFVLGFIIGLSLRPFTGGDRAAFLSDAICVKFFTPVSLLIVLPSIFYFYVCTTLAWIFFGWMLLYFILRRYSGVSKQHAQLDQSFKEADILMSEMKKRTLDVEERDEDAT